MKTFSLQRRIQTRDSTKTSRQHEAAASDINLVLEQVDLQHPLSSRSIRKQRPPPRNLSSSPSATYQALLSPPHTLRSFVCDPFNHAMATTETAQQAQGMNRSLLSLSLYNSFMKPIISLSRHFQEPLLFRRPQLLDY